MVIAKQIEFVLQPSEIRSAIYLLAFIHFLNDAANIACLPLKIKYDV